MDANELEERIARVVAGVGTREDARCLRDACAADPALGRRVAELVAVERCLGAVLAGEDGERRFAAEVIARLRVREGEDGFRQAVERRIVRVRWQRRLAVGALAASLVLAVVGGFWTDRRGGRPVLVRSEAASWEGEPNGLVTADHLEVGRRLALRAGMVELGFRRGVRVVVEGPAVFRIDAEDAMWLERGRIFAEVLRPEGRGFTVDGPGGRVVDLGTRFGVSVAPSGGMEVHVLQGKVEALPGRGGRAMIPLGENEGLRMEAGRVDRIRAEESEFLTALPPVATGEAGFIRWDFEEGDGLRCLNRGRGLAPELATAEMRDLGGGEPPRRVVGPRGGALAFDGRGDYLEAPFKGISGSGARTVAMWVRVPPDLGATESYALIGWGDVMGMGTAWQISVNPDERDGPLGRLRAGTGKGAVVGTTDLRDGRWHHIAAVMYGGPAASTATHVLLYVDGELEATTRKSVREIRTRVDEVGHGIWVARGLSAVSPLPSGTDFFRGEIDEIVLMDAALDQRSIRGLMR